MLSGLLGCLSTNSQSDVSLRKLAELFNTSATKMLNLSHVVSAYNEQCVDLHSHDLIQFLYEFHNPIDVDIHIKRLLESIPPMFFPRLVQYKEFFTKQCTGNEFRFYIDNLFLGAFADNDLIAPLLKSGKCENISLDANKDKLCDVISENMFKKIYISDQWGDLKKVHLDACTRHANELELTLYTERATSVVLQTYDILEVQKESTTLERLIIVFNGEVVDFDLIFSGCDVCKEILMSFKDESVANNAIVTIYDRLEKMESLVLQKITIARTLYKRKRNRNYLVRQLESMFDFSFSNKTT